MLLRAAQLQGLRDPGTAKAMTVDDPCGRAADLHPDGTLDLA